MKYFAGHSGFSQTFASDEFLNSAYTASSNSFSGTYSSSPRLQLKRMRLPEKALGIPFPKPQLIKDWIRANRAEEQIDQLEAPASARNVPPQPAAEPPTRPETEDGSLKPKRRRGSSKSNLEPTLRAAATLERPRGVKKPGRPRIVGSWFPAVAQSMADGTPSGRLSSSMESLWTSARFEPSNAMRNSGSSIEKGAA